MRDPRETLARIRAQANAATEGPWEAEWRFTGWDISGNVDDDGLPALIASESDGQDAEFIAASRTTVPALVDALEAVLDLHKPIPCTIPDGTGVTDGTVCDHCLDPTWPHAIAATITRALEGAPHD